MQTAKNKQKSEEGLAEINTDHQNAEQTGLKI